MTTRTQATLSVSSGPHSHVWQIDFAHPSRSTCACGKVKQHKPIPWVDGEDTDHRAERPVPVKRPPLAKPKRKWKQSVKG